MLFMGCSWGMANQAISVCESLLSTGLCSSLANYFVTDSRQSWTPKCASIAVRKRPHQEVTCLRRTSARRHSLVLQGWIPSLAPLPFCGKAPEPLGCHSAGVPDGCASFSRAPGDVGYLSVLCTVTRSTHNNVKL